MEKPVVFISSTSKDLKPYRAAARDAAIQAGFFPVMMEYFEAGGNPPLETCLAKVRSCDVVVVLVAHRYGWVPDHPKNHDKRCITWLECDEMVALNKKVIPFLIDTNTQWPEKDKENYTLTRAMEEGNATPELFDKVNERIKLLKEFKEWLKSQGTVNFFSNADQLAGAVQHALERWKDEPAEKPVQTDTQSLIVPIAYSSWLESRLARVELLVTVPKEGIGTPRLSSLYVPTPTTPWGSRAKKEKQQEEHDKVYLLLDRLGKESLYVSGIAGCGKSTLCRWVAYLITRGTMPEQEIFRAEKPVIEQFPSELKEKLPLLIPLREFWPYLPHQSRQDASSIQELERALKYWSEKKLTGITANAVVQFIQNGRAVLLFDGMDEVPESTGEGETLYYPRRMLVHGLAEAIKSWQNAGNRIMLTSRPYGLRQEEVKMLSLPQAEIVDLPFPLQELYIRRWFNALEYKDDMADHMLAHLQERQELAPLTGNPVLLMAMCSLYPQGKRLPQDKSELYKMTIDRLLFNRYKTNNEVKRNHERLSVIAYSMHTGLWLQEQEWSKPRAEIGYTGIEKVLSNYLPANLFQETGLKSVQDVREELLSRSGLLVGKGDDRASFYHLTFQEYLAARRMVQMSCDALYEKIVQHGGTPAWRQTLAFAFGSALQDALSSERAAMLIQRLVQTASLQQLDHLVVLGDLIEILYLKEENPLSDQLIKPFRTLCLEAIKNEVDLKKRFDLACVLGIVGDPRLQTDLRKPPLGYAEIPAGRYPVGEGKKQKELKSFLLSTYPVTHGQYRLFVEDGGYEEKCKHFWTDEGWQWLEQNQIKEPRLWHHGFWNGENFPVVGVSWYEADAFCKWAGGRLPTEWEWEAAARGPKGLEFPWGDNWEKENCNNSRIGLNRTSPVGLFPSGRSKAFGLEDMSGNVWEWTDSWYDEKRRVVRAAPGSMASMTSCVPRSATTGIPGSGSAVWDFVVSRTLVCFERFYPFTLGKLQWGALQKQKSKTD
ncbi:SUMF1/EgtB/PvdO family nonheme iron enzyme [candidate division KSB1 bacterium]|nr:SUMF1/EgtB/PvdO family nonheme iron enzyme [candidate division KSB1 bacterium]